MSDSKVPTARDAARAFVNGFFGMVEKVPRDRGEAMVDRLTAAIERDRAATIEACAQIAKGWRGGGPLTDEVARAIRALDTRKAP